MPCASAAAVGDDADVFGWTLARSEIFFQLALCVVTFAIEIGFYFDDDMAIKRINAPTQLTGFEFVFQFNFNRINVERLAQEIQKKMTARIVMLVRANCFGDLLAI